jgi:hypothetical protein
MHRKVRGKRVADNLGINPSSEQIPTKLPFLSNTETLGRGSPVEESTTTVAWARKTHNQVRKKDTIMQEAFVIISKNQIDNVFTKLYNPTEESPLINNV